MMFGPYVFVFPGSFIATTVQNSGFSNDLNPTPFVGSAIPVCSRSQKGLVWDVLGREDGVEEILTCAPFWQTFWCSSVRI